MKKYLTNQVTKMLSLTAIAFIAMLSPAFSQEPVIEKGLINYTLIVSPDQKVKVRLPLDIRSGDRITGTVVDETKNKPIGPGKASATLQGVVIEIDGKKTQVNDGVLSFLVPAGLTSMPFLLKNAAGEVIDLGQIPIGTMMGFADNKPLGPVRFKPAPVCQPDEPLTIDGNFDGNASNTTVNLGGLPCDVIAESPRTSYVQVPQTAENGPQKLTVNENKTTSEHQVNVVDLNLTADKVKLKRSETATVEVKVTGLEGLEPENECKIEVTNRTPSVVRIVESKDKKGKEEDKIEKTVPPNPPSEYKFTFKVVGVTRGAYSIDAVLKCPPNFYVNDWQALNSESPELKKWREKLRDALKKRLKEQGFTEDEIGDILEDSISGVSGIIRNLWRLYKMKTAIDKAYEDAGPKPR